MRFRIVVSTLCSLAWQGSSTLLPWLGLLPSAGRHASCLSSLFSVTWMEPGGTGVLSWKTKNEYLVSLVVVPGRWGPGDEDLFRCGGRRYLHIHTPNDMQHFLVMREHEREYCSLRTNICLFNTPCIPLDGRLSSVCSYPSCRPRNPRSHRPGLQPLQSKKCPTRLPYTQQPTTRDFLPKMFPVM